jgi:uncharacterized protein
MGWCALFRHNVHFQLHLSIGNTTLIPALYTTKAMKRALLLLVIIIGFSSYQTFAQDLPDDVIYSDLMIAARDGQVQRAATLIRNGADINLKTSPYGFTALIIASMWGNEGVTGLLLDAGAKVNDKDEQGNTSLIYASQFGHVEVIRLLLAKSAPINELNNEGKSALYNASILGYDDIVEMLIEASANVNLRTKTGDTALIAAASWGQTDVVKLLLDAGADKSVRNEKGKTAIDIAREKRHAQIIALLN